MGRIRKLISSASREKGIVPLSYRLIFIFLIFFLSRLGFATDDSPCIKPFVFTPPTSYPIDQRLVTEDYQTNIFFHDVAIDNVPREIILESYMHGGGSRSGRGQAGNANAYLYMRDIAPRQIFSKTQEPVLISYFGLRSETSSPYLGIHPREPYQYIKTSEYEGIPETTHFFGDHTKSDLSTGRWMKVRTLPILAEGGNLVLTGDHLITTDQILKDNASSMQVLAERIWTAFPKGSAGDFGYKKIRGLEQIQFKPRSREEIVSILSQYFEIPESAIIMLPWMPGEKTGHADMFVGAPRRGNVVIPYIPEYFLNYLSPFEREKMEAVNHWLDGQTQTLKTQGLITHRMPMQPSFSYKPSTVSPLGYDFLFATPVGWVIKGNTVYVPYAPLAPRESQGKAINSLGEKVDVFHWRAEFGQTSDEAIQRMQEESRAILLGLGFKTVFVRIPENTLMWAASPHCTTGQIALF